MNWLRLDQKAAKLTMNLIGEKGRPENNLQPVETLLKIGVKWRYGREAATG